MHASIQRTEKAKKVLSTLKCLSQTLVYSTLQYSFGVKAKDTVAKLYENMVATTLYCLIFRKERDRTKKKDFALEKMRTNFINYLLAACDIHAISIFFLFSKKGFGLLACFIPVHFI